MENIISTLMTFEDIKFNAGNNKTDIINIGHILAQYITEGVGSRAYQDFNILLNETLSFAGSLDLKFQLMEKSSDYLKIYGLLKDFYNEAIILREFETLVIEVENQLSDLFAEKKNIINKKIDVLCDQKYDLNFRIQIKILDTNVIQHYIKNSIINELEIESKTAHELSKITFEILPEELLLPLIDKYTNHYINQYI